jgi:hypothetical protein
MGAIPTQIASPISLAVPFSFKLPGKFKLGCNLREAQFLPIRVHFIAGEASAVAHHIFIGRFPLPASLSFT